MHADECHTHQDIADHGDHDQEGAEASIHVGICCMGGLLCSPVYETPSVRVLQGRFAKPHTGEGAEQHIGSIDGKECESCQLLVYIVVVEIGMIDGQVPLYRHSTDNAEARKSEEEEDEGAVLTQRWSSRPAVLQVSGNSDWTHQAGPQQIGDCQPTDQRVESGLLLLLPSFAEHHDGYEVAHHAEDEHDGGDSGGLPALSPTGSPIGRAVRRGHDGGVEGHNAHAAAGELCAKAKASPKTQGRVKRGEGVI